MFSSTHGALGRASTQYEGLIPFTWWNGFYKKCRIVSLVLCVPLFFIYPAVSFGAFNASLVWAESKGKHKQIYFSRYTAADNIWSVPVQLTKSKEHNTFPGVGTGKDGRDWVVWSRMVDGNQVLR